MNLAWEKSPSEKLLLPYFFYTGIPCFIEGLWQPGIHWQMMVSIFSNKVFLNQGMYIVFFRYNATANLIEYSII